MPATLDIHSPRRSVTGGGFTLSEMIAVLMVTATLAAVAIPSLASLGSTRSAGAAKLVMRDVAYTRERAMTTGVRCWVSFNTGASSYTVYTESVATPGRTNATVLTAPSGLPFTQAFNSGEFPGVTIGSASFDGGSWIGFDWRGSPLNVSETSLAAQGSVAISGGKTVTVEPGTGLAAAP
jgi:Tfp pilus assembly protein PilE